MNRLAVVVGLVLGWANVAGAQTDLSGPSAGRVLWLQGGRGVDTGLSALTSNWSDPATLAVSQTHGSWMPQWRRHDVHGRPALNFDGDDSLTRLDGMPTGDYTKVAVVSIDDYNAYNNILSGAAEHALFYGYGDTAMLYHSGTFVQSSVPTPLGEPTLLVGTFDATSGEGQLFQNGQLVGTGVAAAHSDPTIQVGSFAYTANFRGSIAEVMIYDRVLSPAERMQVEATLMAKYRAGLTPTIEWTARPRPGEVLPRGDGDVGMATLAGTVETTGYDSVELNVFRDGQPYDQQVQALTYGSGGADFSLTSLVDAGLFEYDFEVRLLRGTVRPPVLEIHRVVCGDLYLVNGQSNAVAADYWGEGLGNDSQSPWIRSFGTATQGADVAFDLHWNQAEALLFNAHGSVGQWALRLAELLVNEHGYPIGLLNGAVGGTSTTQHQRNDANPTDLGTIYGRLLYRAQQAGITEHVRAMLWHQGESDVDDGAGWRAGWDGLRQDWAEDYPNLEKLYLFQVRKGCGVSQGGVREAQRQLAADPFIEIMSTTAVPQHDGCHYFHAGYRRMGKRLSRLLDRDLYASTDTQSIDAPNVASARWTDGSQTSIVLTFEDPDDLLVWESGVEAYFVLDDGTSVISGSASGNTVTLVLSGASTASTVSYDGHVGNGPWVRNDRSVGALTFFGVAIQ